MAPRGQRVSLDWDALPRTAWVCDGMVMPPGTSPPPEYYDQEVTDVVTPASLDDFLAPLRDANSDLSQRLGQRFVVDQAAVLSNGCGDGTATVHRWSNSETGDRLEVWLSTGGETEGDGMIALHDAQRGQVLVVGCACCHPYLLCNEFTFGNSDGSSDWSPPDAQMLVAGAPGAAQVIARLCTLAHTTVFDQIH